MVLNGSIILLRVLKKSIFIIVKRLPIERLVLLFSSINWRISKIGSFASSCCCFTINTHPYTFGLLTSSSLYGQVLARCLLVNILHQTRTRLKRTNRQTDKSTKINSEIFDFGWFSSCPCFLANFNSGISFRPPFIAFEHHLTSTFPSLLFTLASSNHHTSIISSWVSWLSTIQAPRLFRQGNMSK